MEQRWEGIKIFCRAVKSRPNCGFQHCYSVSQ